MNIPKKKYNSLIAHIALIVAVLIISVLPLSLASALELNPFADSKNFEPVITDDMSAFIKEDFNPQYGVIELHSNILWIDTGKIAEYSLTSTSESVINLGMEGKATLYSDGTLFDDTAFKNNKGNDVTLQEGRYFILVTKDNYVDVVDTIKKVCVDVLNKTTDRTESICHDDYTYKEENQPITAWEEYAGQSLTTGDYSWKWEGKRNAGQIVDVLPIKSGKEFTEWTWYDTNWGKKQEIKVQELTGNAWTNYSVLLNVSYDSDMEADFDDLRFVNGTENTELSYYIESKINSNSASVWVNVPYLIANNNVSIYMYYSNPAIATTSNPNNTFVWYDDMKSDRTAEYTKIKLYYLSADVPTWAFNGTGYRVSSFEAGTENGIVPTNMVNMSNLEVFMTGNLNSDTDTHIGVCYKVRTNYGNTFFKKRDSGYAISSVWNNDASVSTTPSFDGTDDDNGQINMTVRVFNNNITESMNGTDSFSINFVNNTVSTGQAGLYVGGSVDGVMIFHQLRIRQYGNPEPTSTFGAEVEMTGLTLTNSIPANNSNISTSSVTFGCNATGSGKTNVTSVVLNVTGAATWTQTINGLNQGSYNATFTNTTLIDGSYNWSCNAIGDTANGTSPMWYFSKDATTPAVNIIYPVNWANYSTNVSELNYTYSDAHPGSCYVQIFDECYQETATGATGQDGSCGLTYNGGYSSPAPGPGNHHVNLNYSKPINFSGTAKIQVKYQQSSTNGDNIIENLTIPSSCLTFNPSYVFFDISSTTQGASFVNCLNSSGWHTLVTIGDFGAVTGAGSNPSVIYDGNWGTGAVGQQNSWQAPPSSNMFYEEAIIWNTPAYITAGTNFTDLTSVEGTNTWNLFCNDTFGNINSSSITFLKDTVYPLINFTTPTETSGSSINRSYILVNTSVFDSNFKNVTYNLYNSTGSLINSTAFLSSVNPLINWINLADGLYYFNATTYDSFGNKNSTETRNVSIDSAAPNINIVYPINANYSINVSELNYTYSDLNPGSCWIGSCYQETANASSAGDGNCGLNYTGNYYGNSGPPWDYFILINYSKPSFSNEFSLWRMKFGDNSATNFVIPSSCWNYNPNLLMLKASFVIQGIPSDPPRIVGGDCYNGSSWINVGNQTWLGVGTLNWNGPFGPYTRVIDGDWNTGALRYFSWYTELAVTDSQGVFYEEAMLWSFQSFQDKMVNVGINFTELTSNEGTNTWTLSCNDTYGNINTSSVTFFKDTTAPLISTVYPTNVSYNISVSELNYTVTDLNIQTCWYSTDGGTTNITNACGTNVTGLISIEGSNTWTVWANDSYGLVNWSTVTFGKDTVKPLSSILFPLNNTKYNINVTDLKFSYTDLHPGNCTMNVSIGIANSSIFSASAKFNFTGISSAEGTNTWTLSCNDTYGNYNVSYVTFFRDTTLPNVSIVYPTNSSYNYNVSALNYTATDTNIQACWYSINNGVTNTSIACGTNATGLPSSEGSNTWKVWANDSYGNINVSEVKFFKDTVNPIISIDRPTNNYIYFNTSSLQGFNYTFTDASNVGTCWYQNLSNTNITIPCAGPSNFTIPNFGVDYVLRLYANDSVGNNATSVSVNITAVNTTTGIYNYPPNTLEGKIYNFTLNITASSNVVITPYFVYNGTSYSTGITNKTSNFTAAFRIPALSGTSWNAQEQFFYWNFSMKYLGGTAQTTNSSFLNSTRVTPIIFWPCTPNINLNVTVLNITFKEETLLIPLNATMDASSWSYEAESNGIIKTFSYTNTTHHSNYTFCIYPNYVSSVKVSATLQYSSSEAGVYPQRTVTFTNETYYNYSVTEKVLYLLDETHGVSSTYSVITIGNQVISGAHIVVEREIGGVDVIVADGLTDDAGQITFWLNPNYLHTFTVSAAGFSTLVRSLKPVSGSYTFTMGGQDSPFMYTNYMEGITYHKWPPSGQIQNTGSYNFTFHVNSSLGNKIYNCSMYIRYPNASLMGSAFGCNDPSPNSGGIISVMLNVTGIATKQLYGQYFITITNNTMVKIEGDAQWHLVLVNANSSSFGRSLRGFINDSIYLPEWGTPCGEGYHLATAGGVWLNTTSGLNVAEVAQWCYSDSGIGGPTPDRYWNQTTDFSRIVFFFIFFVILLAILNHYTGYDTAYPGAFIYVFAGVVFLLSVVNGLAGPGFFYIGGAFYTEGFFSGMAAFMNNWIFFVNVFFLALIYFFTTNKRYQTS